MKIMMTLMIILEFQVWKIDDATVCCAFVATECDAVVEASEKP